MKAAFRRDPLGVCTAILAVLAMGAAVLAGLRQQGPMPVAQRSDARDAGSDALARCRALGEAAGADADCHAAWAESRRRFFSGTEQP